MSKIEEFVDAVSEHLAGEPGTFDFVCKLAADRVMGFGRDATDYGDLATGRI